MRIYRDLQLARREMPELVESDFRFDRDLP